MNTPFNWSRRTNRTFSWILFLFFHQSHLIYKTEDFLKTRFPFRKTDLVIPAKFILPIVILIRKKYRLKNVFLEKKVVWKINEAAGRPGKVKSI